MKLDETAYALALSRERARAQLQLAIDFDPAAHPRDWKGQFKKSLTGMKRGDTRETPSGVKIERKYKGFRVTGPDGSGQSFSSLDQATDSMMTRDAKTTHEKSIGGAKSTTLEQAKKEAKGSVEPKAIRAAMETMSLQDNHLLDNQLERVRESILDTVDPANKPPAKDGAEALKRLKAGEGSYNGRGSSWIPSLNGPNDEARIWESYSGAPRQMKLDALEYSRALDAHRSLRLAANTDIHHTGCMVALYPNPDDAKALAADRGGEPADEMHITLAFLGQAANVDEQALITAVQGWASSVGPIASVISGYGYFTEGPKPVTYWSVDAPRLPAAREVLVQTLDAAGLPVKTDHGFTPHMTIDYAKRKVDPPKGFTMRFGSVIVAHGDNRTRIPLTSHVELAINFDESQVRRDLKGRFSRGTRVRLLSGKGRALAAPDAEGSVRVKIKVPGSILDLDFRSLNLEGKKLRDLKPGDRVIERASKRNATVKSVNGQNVKIKTDPYDYERKVHHSKLAVEDDDITAESVDDVESASVWGVQNGFRLELGDKMNSSAIRDVVTALDKVLAARPGLRDDIGVVMSLSEAAKTPEWDAAAHAVKQADSHHGKLIAQQNPYTRSTSIWINDTTWADDFNQGDAHMQEISDSKRSLGGMVAHELGHVHMLSASATGYVQRAQDLMRDKGDEWISKWLSPYANTNAHEAYAEAFAVLHHPDRPVPDEIRRELEKVVTG